MPTQVAPITVAEWLKQARKALDLTQAELAERAGCSPKTIAKLESGERRPSRELAELLAKALGVKPSEREAFLRFARSSEAPAPDIPAGGSQSGANGLRLPPGEQVQTLNNLPAAATEFIGRERLVQSLSNLLRLLNTRLVTLTGPGGVGKTRLALELGRELLTDFQDGVYFVALGPVSDPALVVPAIARTLGLSEQGGRPIAETLKEYLRYRELLLVLDNFEQVIAAGPGVAELLAGSPSLKLLVTSREVLHLRGEKEAQVPPMSLPEGAEAAMPGSLMTSEAARLFVERAQDAQPDFTATGGNAAAIATICRRLDGLPLAIELVAARSKRFSPQELAERLERPLQLAVGPLHDLPARQRTLRDTIEWSYNLLEEGEQTLFRRLAVFAGGFSLDAVQAVCGPEGAKQPETLRVLESLVDKSLVRYALGGGVDEGPRFGMLETIREYAQERLVDSGEAESLRERHAGHFLALAEEAEPQLSGAQHKYWLDRLELEHDNFRAALRWSLDRGNAKLSLLLCGWLTLFWYYRGHITEGRRWTMEALEGVDKVSIDLAAKLYNAAGILAWKQGNLDAAKDFYEKSLAVWRELGDTRRTATMLYNIAGVLLANAQYEEARPILEEALPFFQQVEPKTAMVSSILNRLGVVAQRLGDLNSARDYYQQCLAIDAETGDIRHLVDMKSSLGSIALLEGRLDDAEQLFREMLLTLKELGNKHQIAPGIEMVASVSQARGRLLRAARLFGAADACREELGTPVTPHEWEAFGKYLSAARAQLDEITWDAARAEGQAMSTEQAVDYALENEPENEQW